ncbi:MAG: hypothetical protein ACXACO_00005, partial [Promethearchaeota archaeon]
MSSSGFIYDNLLSYLQSDKFNFNNHPKTSTAPNIEVYLPANYSVFGKIAPNYSISIDGGPGNYTWYEFLDTGDKSTPIPLNGLLNEDVNETFDQNLWDNLSDGLVTIRFYANDSLNSIGYKDAIIRVDKKAPGPPNILTANPSLWTNTNSFNLSWSNPSDAAGIAGVYYKLDFVPISDTDGVYTPGYDIESIIDISVSTNGTHTVYVWLVDSVENVNYSNYASTLLYLDSIDPSTPSTLVANPDSWTNVDTFNVSWSNPSDISGIVGAYYKLDIAPTSDTDGTYIASADIETIIDISVLTEGIHTLYIWLVDAAGNVNYSNYASTQLYLDSLEPSAPSALIANPNSWTSMDSYNISWSNPSDTSGIVGAYYKLDLVPTSDDDGTYVAGADIELIEDISILTEGIHTIYVWLVDTVGNVNYSNYASTQLYLDSSDPSTPSSLLASPSSWTSTDSFNITWSNPSDTSSIAGVYYKLDIAPLFDDDGTYAAGNDIELIEDISVLTEGIHTIYIWLVDAAGNVNYNNYASTQLYLDSTDPSTPSSLIASPSSWTSTDNFNISWSNPSDTSGIAGAYYKLDFAPTTDIDGTYLAGTNIESILGVSVSTDGIHNVYIWLIDTAGNVNYNNYALTQLYLDSSDPSTPSSLIASPSSWTSTDSFSVSWSNPSDTSGITGVYYKLDIAPTSDADGTYVAGVDIESVSGISVLTEGTHTIYIWLVDAAGNVNYNNFITTQLYLDNSDPSTPILLAASPSTWTNDDDFNITWSNPSDTSGIVGTYYKLDSTPT